LTVSQSLTTRRPPRWVAPALDGVAHAQRPGAIRTACGLRVVEERFAYPLRTRCAACVEALGLAGEPR